MFDGRWQFALLNEANERVYVLADVKGVPQFHSFEVKEKDPAEV